MRIKDEKKEKLIRKKAIELIVREGFDGLSMHKLAKAANVSPATIYIYFKDKEDLIIQICAEEFDKMGEATLANFDPEMSFDEGLKVQWMNRIKYCLENPLNMHFLEQVKFSPYIGVVLEKANVKFREVMRQFVQNATKKGEIVSLPLEVYWSLAFSPLYTLVKFHTEKKGLPGTENFELDEKTMNQTLGLVLKALKP